jgi:hypothetical protein
MMRRRLGRHSRHPSLRAYRAVAAQIYPLAVSELTARPLRVRVEALIGVARTAHLN